MFKNFFSRFHKLKKPSLLLLLTVVLIGLGLPFYRAQADPFSALAGLIAAAIFGTATQLFLAISNLILGLAVWLLEWVISEKFIALCYTCMDNPVIAAGWPLMRDLTNMLFVVMLVFIGLSTALKIGEYTAQKTLPRLIVIALLINFTPVIAGVIIDASNIVMNFFLGGVSALEVLQRQFAAQYSILMQILTNWGWTNPMNVLNQVFQGLVLAIFNLIAAVIFFLFAGLFAVRYVALWILVVLSPVAFASYVLPLPVIKNFWNQWWNQFLQWCLIGVTASFFLYLGNYLMVKLPQLTPPPSSSAGFAGLMTAVLPYGVVLMLLGMGLFTGFATGAMGAAGIISGVQGGATAAGKWTGRTGVDVARGIPAVSRAEETFRRKLEAVPVVGKAVFGGRGAFEASRAKMAKSAEEKVRRNPDTAEGNKNLVAVATGSKNTLGAHLETAAALRVLAERGEPLEGAKMEAAIKDALAWKQDISPVFVSRPDLAPLKEPGKPPEAAIAEAVKAIKPAKMKDISFRALENAAVVAALNAGQLEALTRGGEASWKQKEVLVRKISEILGNIPGTPFKPVIPTQPLVVRGRTINIDPRVINYISKQQREGAWPIV